MYPCMYTAYIFVCVYINIIISLYILYFKWILYTGPYWGSFKSVSFARMNPYDRLELNPENSCNICNVS